MQTAFAFKSDVCIVEISRSRYIGIKPPAIQDVSARKTHNLKKKKSQHESFEKEQLKK